MKEVRDQETAENILEGREAFKSGAGLVDHDDRVLLGLSGKDPSGLLAAIFTNEIPPREDLGVYGLLLDAKGRIQTDLRVLKKPGGLVVEAERDGADAAREILGRYAPFSRVTVEELSEAAQEPWSVLGIYGPRASEVMKSLLGETSSLAEHQTATFTTQDSGASLLVAGVSRPVAGYDVIGPRATLDEARERLLESGAVLSPSGSHEAARIEEGLPRFGSDLTPENFPGEAGILDRAVSFAKGCYPGQETVARMHYRGHPNRSLYRLSVDAGEGMSPEPGARITQDGAEVGYLTSVSPLRDGSALGYLHRKADATARLEAAEAGVKTISAV
jgi:folate-binding protein YgfZ